MLTRIKTKVRNLSRRFPPIVTCNVCGWTGRRFDSDQWHPHTICWKCQSMVRHRLVVEAWQRIEGLTFGDLVQGKRVLHFAPEEPIQRLLQPRAATYRTADYSGQNVDLQLDMSHMPEVADGSFDLAIAADVLEHVPDHIAAMRELFRILAPGGYAVLTVPQKDHLEKTHSDPGITDPAERERLFGQNDHVRIFGNDMPQLLEGVGFQVRVITDQDFPPRLVKRHVLRPPVLSTHPLATNYRRAYFARVPVR